MIENTSIVIKQQIHKICSINIILRCNEICYHSYYLKLMKTQIYSPTKQKDIFHNNVQEMIYVSLIYVWSMSIVSFIIQKKIWGIKWK